MHILNPIYLFCMGFRPYILKPIRFDTYVVLLYHGHLGGRGSSRPPGGGGHMYIGFIMPIV